jgi:prepilin-type N-terminal cleavage/methylation domain-containing protein
MSAMNLKGFTLIEVILAIVILAVAIPALVSSVSFMAARQVNTIGTTIAADLALEKMEEVIGDRINPARGFPWIVSGPNYPGDAPVTGYNRSVSIICVTAADLNTSIACPTAYKRVQVTVSTSGVGPSVPNAVLYTVVSDH